jgi:hypothetical protein
VQAHLLASTDDTHGDLTTVGNQHLLEALSCLCGPGVSLDCSASPGGHSLGGKLLLRGTQEGAPGGGSIAAAVPQLGNRLEGCHTAGGSELADLRVTRRLIAMAS